MTDEEYVYRSDLREKSKIAKSARSAYSKRRRKCNLPADNLTKKELKAMNGPVHEIHEIKLGERMTWEEFRAKPDTLQKSYIDTILSKYIVGPIAIAKLFGINDQYCGNYLRGLGYRFKYKTKPSETARFLADYGAASEPEKTEPQPEPRAMSLEKVVISFAGMFTPEAIVAKLVGLFPESQEVAITVEVAKVAKI